MSSKVFGSLIKGVVKKAKKRKPYEGRTSKKTRKYTKGGSAVQKPMRDAKSKNQRYQRFGDGEDKEVPIPKKKFTETEGTRRDPVGKGSVDAARDVGTRGEKVAQGSKSGANFLTDQSAVGGGRKRAKAKVQLEKLERQNKLTAKEKTQLANIRKADKKAADRQAGKNTKSKLAKSAAQKKVSATKKAEEDLTHFYQTGEMRKGFKPTPQQERQAINNLKARGMSKQAREIEARKELGAKEFVRQKNKEGRKSGGPKEFKSRPEERKYGGKIMKKNMGGPVRQRVGMASKMTNRKAGGPVRQRVGMASKMTSRKAGGPVRQRYSMATGKK